MVCTILAMAGPQRSRILANLYKDERTHALDLFPFMEKVYLEDDDAVNAETYIKKASTLIASCKVAAARRT